MSVTRPFRRVIGVSLKTMVGREGIHEREPFGKETTVNSPKKTMGILLTSKRLTCALV